LDTAGLHRLDLFGLYDDGGDYCAFSQHLRNRGSAPACRGNITTLRHSILVTTHKRWQTLIVKAYALSEAFDDQRRKDFSPEEMPEGAIYTFSWRITCPVRRFTGCAFEALHPVDWCSIPKTSAQCDTF